MITCQMNLKRLDFIKCDVEVMNFKPLKNEKYSRSFSSQISWLQFPIKKIEMIDLLKSLGYDYWKGRIWLS